MQMWSHRVTHFVIVELGNDISQRVTVKRPVAILLIFPKSDVIELDMTVEDAAKLVISAGLAYPPDTASGTDGNDVLELANKIAEAEETRSDS
jgi:hypothetical protein